MRSRERALACTATIAAVVLALTGCFSSGPTLDARAADLADRLEQSDLGVSHADVLAPASFTGSLDVTVVLDKDAVDGGYSVSPERLQKILHVVGEGATDMRVGSAIFYAENDQGADLNMTRAAEELGLSDNVSGRSLSFSGEDLKRLAAT
ncbi:hypothetical protein [uncultured Microbacterium sp.]|uniref:hypothetical protein n=1 Tax=uncultured Microbacterium sp. TaxID=191216 RepID=UPI0025D11692|nr:hypothetical protein [uncultured Microbacterium sp.]